MTIKSLAYLGVAEALVATAYDGAAKLRHRVKTLARQRLGEGEPLLKLQALLEKCRRATEKRNDFIHSVWGKVIHGEAFRRTSDHSWQPLPTVEERNSLGKEIKALTNQLNEAPLEGFLAEALAKRPIVK